MSIPVADNNTEIAEPDRFLLFYGSSMAKQRKKIQCRRHRRLPLTSSGLRTVFGIPVGSTDAPPPKASSGHDTHFQAQLSPPVSHRYTERPFNIPRVCVCAWKQKANNIEDKKKRTRVRSSASDILKQALLPGVSGRGRVQ
jgi:hypothetical protein